MMGVEITRKTCRVTLQCEQLHLVGLLQYRFTMHGTINIKLLLNGTVKILISSVSTEYSRKEQVTKQNKMPQGRGVT